MQPAIFEDIAQEAINLCKISLVTASETLKSRNPPHSVLDGNLFLVRHLLILKEIANASLGQWEGESGRTGGSTVGAGKSGRPFLSSILRVFSVLHLQTRSR